MLFPAIKRCVPTIWAIKFVQFTVQQTFVCWLSHQSPVNSILTNFIAQMVGRHLFYCGEKQSEFAWLAVLAALSTAAALMNYRRLYLGQTKLGYCRLVYTTNARQPARREAGSSRRRRKRARHPHHPFIGAQTVKNNGEGQSRRWRCLAARHSSATLRMIYL